MSVQYPNEVVATKYVRDAVGGVDRNVAPMTLAQASYLMMLCEETGEAFDDSLTQAEAAQLIAQLQDATGRGHGHGESDPPA
jgi:Protein of unknown function (DUF3072)